MALSTEQADLVAPEVGPLCESRDPVAFGSTQTHIALRVISSQTAATRSPSDACKCGSLKVEGDEVFTSVSEDSRTLET